MVMGKFLENQKFRSNSLLNNNCSSEVMKGKVFSPSTVRIIGPKVYFSPLIGIKVMVLTESSFSVILLSYEVIAEFLLDEDPLFDFFDDFLIVLGAVAMDMRLKKGKSLKNRVVTLIFRK